MLVQLNPPLPFQTKEGHKCLAYLVLDYGPEWDTLFLCGMTDTRELWWFPQKELRLQDNISLGRPPQCVMPAACEK